MVRLPIAIFSAARGSSVRRWSAIDHPTTRREKRSISTARKSHPSSVLMHVMSPTQTLLGASAVNLRSSRFSTTGWLSSLTVVAHRRRGNRYRTSLQVAVHLVGSSVAIERDWNRRRRSASDSVSVAELSMRGVRCRATVVGWSGQLGGAPCDGEQGKLHLLQLDIMRGADGLRNRIVAESPHHGPHAVTKWAEFATQTPPRGIRAVMAVPVVVPGVSDTVE